MKEPDRYVEIIRLIQQLMHRNYYGEITIRFENGVIVFAKKTENIKFKKF